MNTKSAAHTAE